MNTFRLFVDQNLTSFAICAHPIPAPMQGGIVNTRMDWFAVSLIHQDSHGIIHTANLTLSQSKVRHGEAPTLYYVLVLLMADFMAHMHYPTFAEYWAAVPCFDKARAEIAYAVTVERSEALIHLLGVDLQPFLQAYGDDTTVTTASESLLMIVERAR